MKLVGGGSVAVAVGISDMWHVIGDRWHLTRDTWHLTPDTWPITHDTWHRTPETWHLTPDNWFLIFFKSLSVLLSAPNKRFIVSRMRDFVLSRKVFSVTLHISNNIFFFKNLLYFHSPKRKPQKLCIFLFWYFWGNFAISLHFFWGGEGVGWAYF